MYMDVEKFKELKSKIILLMMEYDSPNQYLLALLSILTIEMFVLCQLDDMDFNILIETMRNSLEPTRLSSKSFYENETENVNL